MPNLVTPSRRPNDVIELVNASTQNTPIGERRHLKEAR